MRCCKVHAATCCNMLQHSAITYAHLQVMFMQEALALLESAHCNMLQHAPTHCYSLHRPTCLNYIHTLASHVCAENASNASRCVFATLCNTLQHTATCAAAHCNYMRTLASHVDAQGARTAAECAFTTRCNTLQHTATHCIFTCIVSLLKSARWLATTASQRATHCNTLQHTAGPE